ncbi:MAG: transposase [Telluria sp.]
MSRYRRQSAGSTYFFTVVAYRRRPIFCDPTFRAALRRAIQTVCVTRPFTVDAWVLMPDHMHCIWTLPQDDHGYSTRWAEIKRYVSSACRENLFIPHLLTRSGKQRNESTIWQRRFWEHQIRDAFDMEKHVDYIHFNPVKHGHVQQVCDWPYSTFHRYVREGIYVSDWAGTAEMAELDLE